MKKLLIFTAVFILATAAFAAENPTDKGSMILNGNASFSSISGEDIVGDESVSIINIVPSLGFFISPNLMIGADLEYIKVSYGDLSGSSFGIGPTIAYYINSDPMRMEAKGAMYPYLKAFFIYTTSKLEEDEEGTPDFNTTSFGGQGGIVFMLSNAVGADFSVRYSFDKLKPEGADESADGNTLNIGVGITAFIY